MQNSQPASVIPAETVCRFVTPAHTVPNLADDVRNGLLDTPRSLPPKYFYDARGSELFAQICDTPEYYPTRTEDALLRNNAAVIIADVLPDQILELGSGNSQKTRRLFDACEDLDHACSYAPFDVCTEILQESAGKLRREYDWLQVTPLAGDYHAGLGNIPETTGRRLLLFLGGTIGNFPPHAAREFLQDVYAAMSRGDYLLLGTDRVKDNRILNAAYNDEAGITADFNLNLLNVLNRELQANFRIDHFDHLAFFNESANCIEMRLVSNRDHRVTIQKLQETILFRKDDQILTEVSHKYTFDGAENLLKSCGFAISNHYQPENNYFSLILAQK